MSLTVHTNSDELKQAIRDADASNILMFCSANDQGGTNTEKCYPGDWNMCLCIGAAN
ncbi:hypothetical protein LZ30DRAFT_610546 [Colletotrichum cereale]|nr:hypothetical protein LZ30DRAFT_610546 [Colletotrichum cereale]